MPGTRDKGYERQELVDNLAKERGIKGTGFNGLIGEERGVAVPYVAQCTQ